MEKVKLAAKTREVFGRKTKKGRKEGLIPAVVYGRGIKTKSLWIKALDFLNLIKKSGESTMINLKIGNKDDPPRVDERSSRVGAGRNVIIYETQKDPVSNNLIHVDFFQVKMDEEIETEVELVYIGDAPAVKEMGGVLVKNLDEITVKCLPADLPSEIKVDITSLKTFDDRVCIKDLNISPKIKVELIPETVVALVAPPRSEEELAGLSEKVEEDVSKVEGVVKEPVSAESGEALKEEETSKEASKEAPKKPEKPAK